MIAGTAVGRVRAMVNDKGRRVKTAPPSTPVEILGLSEAPSGGDTFMVVENENLHVTLLNRENRNFKKINLIKLLKYRLITCSARLTRVT